LMKKFFSKTYLCPANMIQFNLIELTLDSIMFDKNKFSRVAVHRHSSKLRFGLCWKVLLVFSNAAGYAKIWEQMLLEI